MPAPTPGPPQPAGPRRFYLAVANPAGAVARAADERLAAAREGSNQGRARARARARPHLTELLRHRLYHYYADVRGRPEMCGGGVCSAIACRPAEMLQARDRGESQKRRGLTVAMVYHGTNEAGGSAGVLRGLERASVEPDFRQRRPRAARILFDTRGGGTGRRC